MQQSVDTQIHEAVDDVSKIINKMVKNTLTRANLLKQQDWKEWEQSEFLQLNQYEQQGMFDPPGPTPSDLSDYIILPKDQLSTEPIYHKFNLIRNGHICDLLSALQ